eukprot:gene14922-biopygen21679
MNLPLPARLHPIYRRPLTVDRRTLGRCMDRRLDRETAQGASGTRPFLQILSCGTHLGRVRDASAAVSSQIWGQESTVQWSSGVDCSAASLGSHGDRGWKTADERSGGRAGHNRVQ